jgi:hypothetical protein
MTVESANGLIVGGLVSIIVALLVLAGLALWVGKAQHGSQKRTRGPGIRWGVIAGPCSAQRQYRVTRIDQSPACRIGRCRRFITHIGMPASAEVRSRRGRARWACAAPAQTGGSRSIALCSCHAGRSTQRHHDTGLVSQLVGQRKRLSEPATGFVIPLQRKRDPSEIPKGTAEVPLVRDCPGQLQPF